MKQQNNPSDIILGCGLIRIGRIWGVDSKPVPSEVEVSHFLEGAFELGVRFFDTAPAYGLSEERLGAFLKRLTPQQRNEITIATKFGEHWNREKEEPFTDHSYEKLLFSLDQSLKILGKIDILQLHKASAELLNSPDINRAFEVALNSGVSLLGASISDIETGLKACHDQKLSHIQLPFNQNQTHLLPVVKQAKTMHKKILFNRPFAMGAITNQTSNREKSEENMVNAYKEIIVLNCPGVILTGTASLNHLKQNLSCFKQALLK